MVLFKFYSFPNNFIGKFVIIITFITIITYIHLLILYKCAYVYNVVKFAVLLFYYCIIGSDL